MTTTEITKLLSKRLDISQREARDLLRLMCETIVANSEENKTTVIRGFGSFSTRIRKARIGFHPGKRKRMVIPPRVIATFKPSAKLKENLASGKSQ